MREILTDTTGWGPWLRWASAIVFVIWVVAGPKDAGQFPVIVLLLPMLLTTTRHVLVGGMLVSVTGQYAPSVVPLAVAEVVPAGRRWQVSWPDGRRVRRVRLAFSEAFGLALEQAGAATRSAPAGSVPQTAREAGRAVAAAPLTSQWLISLTLLGFMVLQGLSVVTAYGGGLYTFYMRTNDPAFARLEFNSIAGHELARRVKRRLSGASVAGGALAKESRPE